MQNVFWFTGRSCSGKTTLTKKLKKILEKDFSNQVIDSAEYATKLGGRKFKTKEHDAFIKKLVSLVNAFSKQNELVLVAIATREQKHRNYARKMLGNKYHEIFLQCSDRCLADRMKNRRGIIFRKILKPVLRLYRFHSLSKINSFSFETPLSPDLIINTEKETIVESINNIINFIHSKNGIHQPSK